MMLGLFTNVVTYLAFPVGIILGSVGICCAFSPQKTTDVIKNGGWNMNMYYVWFKDECSNIFNNDPEKGYDADDEYEEKTTNTMIYFDKNQNSCVTDTSNINNINAIIEKHSPKIVFFEKNNNDGKLIKRVNTLSNYDITHLNNMAVKKLTEPPFIQVEYIDKKSNIVLNLHDKLADFYVSDNLLFDMDFMKLFLKFFYNRNIAESYIIRIFDKDVNLIELDSTQCIRLLNTKKGYEVISTDTVETRNEFLINKSSFSDNESDGTPK